MLRDTITNASGELTNQSIPIQQGFLSEAHHTQSYNIEAKASGVFNTEASMEAVSAIDPLTDVRITSSNGKSVDFQLKFYADSDKTAKALSKSKYRQNDIGKVAPAEQVKGVKETAAKQAKRNSETRPSISKDYKHTEKTATDSISHPDHPDVASKPLNRKGTGGSDDLTKKINKGKKVEYEHVDKARSAQQALQYKNAAKAGAVVGFATSAAAELIDVLTSKKELSQKDCEKIAGRIILGTAKGAGQALLTTAVQHAGKEIAKASSKGVAQTLGSQLAKGNIAANVSVLAVQLGGDIIRYRNGEIDGVEFAESSINNSISLASGAAGFAMGTAAASYIGTQIATTAAASIATSIGGVSVGGITTLGALGPIGLGIAGAIASSMAVSAYTGHFSKKGHKIAIEEIETATSLLTAGDISLGAYTGKIGVMSEFKFTYSDLLPLSGSFAVFGEYKARKSQLKALQDDIASKRKQLPQQEMLMLKEMEKDYKKQIKRIESNLAEQKSNVDAQAEVHYKTLHDELDQHLERKFSLISHSITSHKKVMDSRQFKIIKEQDRISKLKFFQEELEVIRTELEITTFLSSSYQAQLKTAVTQRITNTLPVETPFDIADNFLRGETYP